MNSFGRLFRVSILGESHGAGVGALLDGCPAGLPLASADFEADLARRRAGAKGTTPRHEADVPVMRAGVFQGRATGAPLLVWFDNADVRSSAYEALANTPRPGHADWVARQKSGGFNDPRGGGHFSGRLSVALVAAGVVAKKLMPQVRVEARLTEAGGSPDVEAAVDAALAARDSVGGVVECRVSELPAGLGEPFFDSAESLLSHAVFAIPAVKGVEFGDGFAASRRRGSEVNDAFADASGRTQTNHAGGINGGLTNGNELVLRAAVKPTSSIARPQISVDLRTGEQVELSVGGRHDACIALRVPVVLEAAVAMVLADLMMLEGRIPRVWR
jgi:chorismate synthase